MSKKIYKFRILFFSRVQLLIMSKKCPVMSKKFPPNFTLIHQFSLPSSTISPYFNSSYYSFFTFFTLYSILFNISQKKFLLRPNGGGFNPQTPTLPTPLGLNEIG